MWFRGKLTSVTFCLKKSHSYVEISNCTSRNIRSNFNRQRNNCTSNNFNMANMASACALVVSDEKNFNPIRSWTTKTAATTCGFVTVSVISICIMVVCGVIVVREYALSQSYIRNHCWVKDISYTEVKVCNYCPGHKTKDRNSALCHHSKFPCVQVIVAYEADGIKREGLLHSGSIEASGLFSQCSHHVCMKDYEENEKAINHYVDNWKNLMFRHYHHHLNTDIVHPEDVKTIILTKIFGYISKLDTRNSTYDDDADESGSNTTEYQAVHKFKKVVINTTHNYNIDDGYFVCFVNEEDPHDVIEHKNYTKSDVIHCMFWPALVVLLCCCAFLYIESSKRHLTFCGHKEQPPDSNHFFHAQSFLLGSRVKVLDRSHYMPTSLEECPVKCASAKHKETETRVKKAAKSHPVENQSLLGNRVINKPRNCTDCNPASHGSRNDANQKFVGGENNNKLTRKPEITSCASKR